MEQKKHQSTKSLLWLASVVCILGFVACGGGIVFYGLAVLCALPAVIVGPRLVGLLVLLLALVGVLNTYPDYQNYLKRQKQKVAVENLYIAEKNVVQFHSSGGSNN